MDFIDLEGCDPENCTQCNPRLQQLYTNFYHREDYSVLKEELKEQILADRPRVKFSRVEIFYYWTYLRNGYSIRSERISVEFIKSKFTGILTDSKGNLQIHYSQFSDLDFCDSEFMIGEDEEDLDDLNERQHQMIEIESQPHLKLNLEHSIYEDYVHRGYGLILKRSSLLDL